MDASFAMILFVLFLIMISPPNEPRQAPKVNLEKQDDVIITKCPCCSKTIGIEVEGILKAESHDDKHCPYCRRGISS